MAIQKVKVTKAVIKIKANGGTADPVEMYCLEGAWDIHLGDFGITKIECSGGVEYEKSDTPELGTATWKGKFDGAMADEAQALLMQGLYNKGDFAIDNSMHVDIHFPNLTDETADGPIMRYDVIIKSGKCVFDPKGKLGLDFVVQQINIPALTPTA